MNPTAPTEREPLLDVLRGFAVLGILLVNVESMRGSDWLVLMSGGSVARASGIDSTVQFALGWLVTGKFVASLALLFGVGAGLIVERSLRAGVPPRTLLARRYALLIVFGIAHTPIFSGDVLFLYGVSGLALLPFVILRPRALIGWSLVLLAVYSLWGLAVWAGHTTSARGPSELAALFEELRRDTVEAFTAGSLFDMLGVQARHGLLLQPTQLFVVPWVLALFLFGSAVARAGIATNLPAHRSKLRAGALVGLGIGLPANLASGWVGPLAAFGVPATEPQWVVQWAAIAQAVATPVLAVGYLCALALFCLRYGHPARLAAVGRMALTAYLLQSVIALGIFGGLRLYDTLSTTSALLVVAFIWAILLVACPWWLSRFRFGPAEWLWRFFTYKMQSLKAR